MKIKNFHFIYAAHQLNLWTGKKCHCEDMAKNISDFNFSLPHLMRNQIVFILISLLPSFLPKIFLKELLRKLEDKR